MAEKPDKPDSSKPGASGASASDAPKPDAGKPDPGKQTTAQALTSSRPVSSSAPGSAPPGGADSPPNMFAAQATGPNPSEQGSGQGPGQGQGQQGQGQGQGQSQSGQGQGGQSSQAPAGQQAPQGQDKTVQGATDPTSVPGPMFQGDPAAQNIYLGIYSDVQSGRTVEVVHPSVFKEGDEQSGAHVMYRDMGNDRFYFTPLSEFAQQGKYARRS